MAIHMAIHAILSPLFFVASTKPQYSSSFPAKLPCLPQTSHLYFETRNPRTSISQFKLNVSTGEESDELDQSFFDGNEETEDENEEGESESSVDLFFRFLQSMFRKVSKRATRSSYPCRYATAAWGKYLLIKWLIWQIQVSLAVDGVLLSTSLSIVKAL